MSLAKKLKYSGNDPYEPEEQRLPYPIFEALSQDDEYQLLAELRHAADHTHDKTVDAGLGDAERHAFAAYNDSDKAVNAYVTRWVATVLPDLRDGWDIDDAHFNAALAEYDLPNSHEVDA